MKINLDVKYLSHFHSEGKHINNLDQREENFLYLESVNDVTFFKKSVTVYRFKTFSFEK